MLQQQKRDLRLAMSALRQAGRAENTVAHQKLAELFIDGVELDRGAIVAAYLAFRDEIDPAPLVALLRARGHPVALPLIAAAHRPLQFRLYHEVDPLARNDFGMLEPLDTAPAAAPDVILTPLLAFDRERHRLGYGGGFYDRTLAALRAVKPVKAIGLGYGYQEVPQVPAGPHDIKLDLIVTDLNIL